MPGRLIRFLPEWLLGAVCLAIPGLWNRFPLLNSDTGAYIENGYKLYVPLDRPLGYSVFLRLGLMDLSLWIPVFLQCLLLAGLLLALTRYFLGPAYSRFRAVGAMLLMGTLSSAGWFAAQLSPDIFSAVLMLCVLCLAIIPMEKPWRWILYALILLSILCHNSNVLITAGTGAVLLLLSFRRRSLRRLSLELLIPATVGGLTLCTLTAIAERGFRPSAGSHVFLMSRMVETGMMTEFLRDYCPVDSPRYRLCDWQDGLTGQRQWDFMWDAESPLQKAGGWVATEAEYNRIIRKTLTRPKYIGLHLKYAAIGTVQQLPLLQAGDGLARFDSGSSPYDRIRWYLPDQLPPFRNSLQSRSGLPLDWWNPLLIGAELLIVAAGLALWFRKQKPPGAGFRRALALTILLLLVNAAVTATFATVIARYQSRVFWILPFLSILYVLRWLHFRAVNRRPQH